MIAENFVKRYGKNLIGRTIYIVPTEEYPGGFATVIDLGTINDISEVAMNVKFKDIPVEIGIFNHDEVSLWKDGFLVQSHLSIRRINSCIMDRLE